MGRRWGGMALGLALMMASVRLAGAQEPGTKDPDLEAIKKRLELLEQEKADRDAEKAAKEAHGADFVQDKWTDHFKVGAGVRADFRVIEEEAPGAHTSAKVFDLDSARVYLSGNVNKMISGVVNLDFSDLTFGTGSGSKMSVLDAYAAFHFADEVNIWMGRFLPPQDRLDLDGPYYTATWGVPFVSHYPAIFAGRDDGAVIWGDLMKGMFHYAIGAFNGNVAINADPNFDTPVNPTGTTSPSSNRRDDLLYAARFMVDLWDPENNYYTQSTYYGEKDILAIAIAGQWQRNGLGAPVGTPGPEHQFLGGNIDVLFEKKMPALADGTLTVELALYFYTVQDNVNAAGIPGLTGTYGRQHAYYGQISYLIPKEVGWGKFQPFIAYQKQDDHRRSDAPDVTEMDLGINYVMSGHNARISLVWSNIDVDVKGVAIHDDIIRVLLLGVQIQM
jgi:hypothetical protein